MKKFTNTEAELKKRVAYIKSVCTNYSQRFNPNELYGSFRA